MWAFYFLLIFTGLTLTYVLKADSINTGVSTNLIADADAVSFMAYRKAVINYLEDNPEIEGEIGSVEDYYPTGFINKNTSYYQAVYKNKKLFVFSLKNIDAKTLSDRFYRSVVVGHNINGRLISLEGIATDIDVPTEIPNNSVVVLGR